MKSSYHPSVIVAFYLHCLPEELIQRIPRSTRFDWQHKDLPSLFGYEWFCLNRQLFNTLQQISNNKKLLAVNRALIRVIAIKRFITKYAACLKERLFNVPWTIAQNICKVRAVFKLSKTLRFLQLPYSAYLIIRRSARCVSSPLGLCRIKHPAQLTQHEISVIKTQGEDPLHLHWPLSAIFHYIRRQGLAYMGISTFYKHAAGLKLQRKLPSNRRKHHHTGIRASAPLHILHADTTGFITADNQKGYIYLIQDNFSRTILQPTVAFHCKAAIMFSTLEQVYKKYLQPACIENCQLITDDGSENYGEVKRFINCHPVITHLVAQKDIIFSNSMVEAANKQLKYRFLYHRNIPDFDTLESYVQKAVEDYNNRPHHILYGLTPLEVLNGKIPDKYAFASQINMAKANRLIDNKKTKCCYSF